MAGQEVTALTPAEEDTYRRWLKASQITDAESPDAHYDYRGYFKETNGAAVPMSTDRHFPDTYKQHGHPTFSVESKYSKGANDGGRWEGDRYVAQADQGGEVVIVGTDGKEHVFPPGFDPKRAAGIVKQGELTGLSKAESIKGPMSLLDRLLGMLPAIGGATGGVIGGAGGSVLGMGFGGAPGAIGGAALGGATGEAMRQNARRVLGGDRAVPSTPGEAAKDIGTEGGIQALYELGGNAVSGALSAGGRAVYRGYLKPSLSAQLAPRAKDIVETGIREALPVTETGAAKADALITSLNQEVDRILASTKGDVNLSTVADQIRSFAKRTYYLPGKPMADYKAAMKVADELDNHPSMAPVPPRARVDTVNLPTANSIKQGLDASVGTSNFGVDREATKTAQKVGRYGMRNAIEAQAPAVGPINARESQLIDLADALNRATGREGNRNQLFGVPSMVAGTVGVTEAAHGASRYGAGAMALATRIGLTPAVATRAAIIAAKLGDTMPGTAVADIARAAVEAVKALSETESQAK